MEEEYTFELQQRLLILRRKLSRVVRQGNKKESKRDVIQEEINFLRRKADRLNNEIMEIERQLNPAPPPPYQEQQAQQQEQQAHQQQEQQAQQAQQQQMQ